MRNKAKKRNKIVLAILAMIILLASPGFGSEPITIATAANFIQPMKRMLELFSLEHGIHAQATYGSSSKLFAQIRQGAPYDIFLSADADRPQHLYKLNSSSQPFRYATGQVVLWSSQTLKPTQDWQQLLRDSHGRIAIANPLTAPYGQAAIEALTATKLLSAIKTRLVYGQTVSQAFQYAATKSTEFAFVALSSALSEHGQAGSYIVVEESALIHQYGCLLKNSQQPKVAELFITFLKSPAANKIKKEFGYRP